LYRESPLVFTLLAVISPPVGKYLFMRPVGRSFNPASVGFFLYQDA
jgi:hypothetical protein